MCNKCYGMAIGYLELHFKRLKGVVRAGCVAAIHENSQRISRGNAYICGSRNVGAIHSGCGMSPTTSGYQALV